MARLWWYTCPPTLWQMGRWQRWWCFWCSNIKWNWFLKSTILQVTDRWLFGKHLCFIWLRWEHFWDVFEHYLKNISEVRTSSRYLWTLFQIFQDIWCENIFEMYLNIIWRKHLWGETIFRYLWTLFEHQASLKYLWNIFETIVDIFENSLKHPWNILVTRDFDFQ